MAVARSVADRCRDPVHLGQWIQCLARCLPATPVTTLKVLRQGLASNGRTYTGDDFFDVMCPTMANRIQSMLVGMQVEQLPTCDVDSFLSSLRRLAFNKSARLAVVEPAIMAYVDTVAEARGPTR